MIPIASEVRDRKPWPIPAVILFGILLTTFVYLLMARSSRVPTFGLTDDAIVVLLVACIMAISILAWWMRRR